MDCAYPKRKDLVKNFPTSYSYSALCSHFSQEYKQLLGYEASKPLIHSVTCTFLRQWKNIRKKERFLVAKSSQSWLETALPLQENTAKGQDLLREIDSTPTNSSCPPNVLSKQIKPRKPFHCLTDSGKEKRLRAAVHLQQDELEYLMAKKQKRRRLDFSPQNLRKRDNQICLHYFDINLPKIRYIEASQR
jgi:hypothetical protein